MEEKFVKPPSLEGELLLNIAGSLVEARQKKSQVNLGIPRESCTYLRLVRLEWFGECWKYQREQLEGRCAQ